MCLSYFYASSFAHQGHNNFTYRGYSVMFPYIQTVYELIRVTGMPSTWKHLAFLCARNVQFLPIELQNHSMFWNTQIVVVNHNYPSGLCDHGSYSSQLGVVTNSYRSSMWKAEAQGNSFYIVNSVSDTKHVRAASQEGIHASCCSLQKPMAGEVIHLGGINYCCFANWSLVNLHPTLILIVIG